MKKAILAVALVMAVTAVAGSAFAGTVQPIVNVTATVQGTCRIITSPGAMSFDIDPGLAGPVPATVATQPTVRCTNGLGATVTGDSAGFAGAGGVSPQTGTLTGPGNMNYSFTFNNNIAGTGHGAGQDVSLGVVGSIAAAAYENATASAAYVDTITFTVTF